MKISHDTVGTPRGRVDLYTITNATGASVMLSSIGAGIVEVCVPDSHGQLGNVALRYADISSYFEDGPCMGKTPGRYANRIARGHFTLDGKEYTLATNCGPNHLHGGPTGFQNHIWQSETVGDDTVRFRLHSPDGDEGYPGNLDVTVSYRWSDDNRLLIEYEARTDAPTVINLTNHTYWNLRNWDAGTALNHKLQLNANHYLVTDESLAPTGEIAPVKSTPMDFTIERPVGEQINKPYNPLKYGKGYDSCWVLDRSTPETLELAATLLCPITGRQLTVRTTQPGVQVYTANWMDGSPVGPGGHVYHDYDAVAIECQQLPDSPNHPDFPCTILRPGEVWRQAIEYAFNVIDY